MAGIVQMRHDTDGRAYYRRKLSESKTPMEAMRCLRRRLSDVVYRKLIADAQIAAQRITSPAEQAGPGGHPGATVQSSAADLPPDIGTSDQSLPGPAPATLPAPAATAQGLRSPDNRQSSRRAGGVNLQRPTGRTRLTPTNAGAPSGRSRTRT